MPKIGGSFSDPSEAARVMHKATSHYLTPAEAFEEAFGAASKTYGARTRQRFFNEWDMMDNIGQQGVDW